jgi:putative membrane protein
MRLGKIMKNIILTILKGAAMGAADAVPGVSGGTLALILGVYERLINALSSFNIDVIKMIFTGKISQAWKAMDANFLLQLFTGMVISLLSLLLAVKWLIENQPILLWSFFLGLVLMSVWYLARQFRWNTAAFVLFPIGLIASASIMLFIQPSSSIELTMLTAVIAGSIAICAMILPGLSGSFMLILMGLYVPISQAVHDRNLLIIVTFAGGCALGLLSFSKVLRWLLANYHSATLSLMTGIVAGASIKLWPWQNWAAQSAAHEEKSFVENQWYLPMEYTAQTNDANQVVFAIVVFCIGAGLILALDLVGRKVEKTTTV